MTLVLPSVGAVGFLDDLTDANDYWIHLYANLVVLGPDTTLGSFVEASFPGYLPRNIPRWFNATWQVDRAVAFADPVVWTRAFASGSQTIYGAYLTLGLDGPLRYAEARPWGPLVVDTNGQVIEYNPRLSLRADPQQT